MNFERALNDEEFRTMLSKATEIMDAHYRDRAAAEELCACVDRLQLEADRLHERLGDVAVIANRAQGESLYWRGRAALMMRALRQWQQYETALADDTPAKWRAYARAHDATAEAMKDFSQGALQ